MSTTTSNKVINSLNNPANDHGKDVIRNNILDK